MHAFGETGPGVPAFLAKLWRLVEDPETNNLICWNKDGRSFIIQNQAQFARELLPLNYKHNNMASFIRQLNMYGFHKITSIDNGGLKFDRDEMEFSHPCFKRNCAYLLEHIKRKIANSKAIDEKSTIKPEAVSRVLSDVKAMRGRQDSLDSRFSVMKQENEALWREIASLRQKHTKQQQIVNKLIQFLITIVQPGRNMTTVKRHMQLMIDDTPEQANLRKGIASECGPVIHELEEELLDEVSDRNSDLGEASSPYASVDSSRPDNESPKEERSKSNVSVSSHGFDFSNQGTNDVASIGKTTPTIINTVNADGSEIVYHVTEVPDSVPPTPESFNDENHITTPMVKEMTRIQMKSNKNKRKSAPSTVTTSSPSTKMLRTEEADCHNIKTEHSDIDPMMLLDADYALTSAADVEAGDSDDITGNVNPITGIDPRLILRQKKDCKPEVANDKASDMFNIGDFAGSDMPSELFEPIIEDANVAGRSDFSQIPTSTNKQLVSVSDWGIGDPPSVSKNLTLQVAKVNNSTGEDPRDEVNSHLEGVQDDLDTLKDLLRGDGYSLDANTLMGLFNESDILGPYGLLMTPDSSQNRKGSELMSYNTQSIYDLGDMMDMSDASDDTNVNGNNSKKSEATDSVLNTPYHE